jgi:hypothetical protein
MATQRVNVVAWTNLLRAIYERYPGVTAAKFVLSASHNMWESAASILSKIETDKAPSQWEHLRGIMKELSRFNSRLLYYYHHFSLDVAENERLIVKPLLYGVWPVDFPEEIREPAWTVEPDGIKGRADVTQIAMIYNQAIEAARAFDDVWNWWLTAPLGSRIAEGLMGAKKQAFEEAAPGEPPTARDELGNTIDKVIEDTGGLIHGLAPKIGVGLVLLGGLALVAAWARKD